jgi:hypothetical protein
MRWDFRTGDIGGPKMCQVEEEGLGSGRIAPQQLYRGYQGRM